LYRGLSTGIYATNSPDACQYVASHARCNVIVVDDDKQLQKILSIRDRLPQLRAIVQYRGQPDKRLEGVYSVYT
jgi:long-chain-fatty-acid--CoA ligase ACSBG